MARYGLEYRERRGRRGPRGGRWSGRGARGAGGHRAGRYGYGEREYGYGDRAFGYGRELARGAARWGIPTPGIRKPAHGFPVRGIHTYDLDYGGVAGGPTTDYSGRAGYPTGPEEAPRGPYTPRLEEVGPVGAGRGLYGGVDGEYRGRGYRGGRRPRRPR